MNFLDKYPDLLTVNQIAEILNVNVNMVYRLPDLIKIRIGQGRGLTRCRKIDLINYLKSREDDGGIFNENKKKERHGKMGLSTLLPWKELQKLRLSYEG
jgi:hypothetical protein